MNSTRQLNLLILFISLLSMGVLFGNIVLMLMALMPLMIILAGTLYREPHNVEVQTDPFPPKLRLGREFTLVRTVTVHDGCGLIRIHQQLPEEFELIEGTNIRVAWKHGSVLRLTVVCRLRCSKRGDYFIPPVEWASRHPLFLSVDSGKAGEELILSVWPRLLKHRNVQQLKNLALSPYPLADTSKIGVAGTDFREIRSYVSGDPVKTINWKATAHRAHSGFISPLVNEFEREGRKSVLLFMDGSRDIEIGTRNRNVLEFAIEATSNLLYYFIGRGYRVGVAVSGERNQIFYPDSGRQQLTRIIPQLVKLQAGGEPVDLLATVDSFRQYIGNHKPLSIIVTTIDGKSSDVFDRFFDKLKSCYNHRRRAPIVFVNVIGRDLIPVQKEYDGNLSLLMNLQARPKLYRARHSGVTVIEWNPDRQSFHSVMAGRMRR